MSKEILRDIQKSIEKNLPAEVGEVLKVRLDLATSLEKKIKELQREAKADQQRLENQDNDVCRLEDALGTHEELDTREKVCAAREELLNTADLNLTISLLQKDVECARVMSDGFANFMVSIARNTEFRRSFHGGVPVGYDPPSKDQWGSPIAGTPITVDIDQETTDTAE